MAIANRSHTALRAHLCTCLHVAGSKVAAEAVMVVLVLTRVRRPLRAERDLVPKSFPSGCFRGSGRLPSSPSGLPNGAMHFASLSQQQQQQEEEEQGQAARVLITLIY